MGYFILCTPFAGLAGGCYLNYRQQQLAEQGSFYTYHYTDSVTDRFFAASEFDVLASQKLNGLLRTTLMRVFVLRPAVQLSVSVISS